MREIYKNITKQILINGPGNFKINGATRNGK